MVFVGLISYSLYLWHWPLFAFARNQTIAPLSPNQRLMLVVASLVLGVLSWRYVEVPFRSRRLLASRRRLLAVAAFSYAALLCGGIMLHGSGGFDGRLPPWPGASPRPAGRTRYGRNVEVEDVPGNLIRLGDRRRRGRTPGVGRQPCDVHPAGHRRPLPGGGRRGLRRHAYLDASGDRSLSPARYGLNERAIPFNAAVMEHIRSGKIRTVLLVATWGTYIEEASFPDAL